MMSQPWSLEWEREPENQEALSLGRDRLNTPRHPGKHTGVEATASEQTTCEPKTALADFQTSPLKHIPSPMPDPSNLLSIVTAGQCQSQGPFRPLQCTVGALKNTSRARLALGHQPWPEIARCQRSVQLGAVRNLKGKSSPCVK